MVRRLIATAAIAVLSVAGFASASGVYTVTSLSNTPDGNGNFVGYDPDKPAPAVTANGFFASGNTGDYNSVRFTPGAIGMTGLTLGQITQIAYDHSQLGGGIDWQLKVYTVSSPATGSGWYGYRLNYDLSTGNVDGSWSTFTDTNADAERIKPKDSADVYRTSQPTNFSNLLSSIGGEQVLFFDISAGANSGGYPYNTFLNNIQISADTFGTSTLTAVPLPASAWAGMTLLGLLLGHRALKSRRPQVA